MYYIYILNCADNTFYTGSTNNLKKRIREHNHAKNGAHYTKIRRPVEMIYSESFTSYAEARAREAEIKRMNRNEKQILIKKSQL